LVLNDCQSKGFMLVLHMFFKVSQKSTKVVAPIAPIYAMEIISYILCPP